ncbi:hypothetical protein JOQ06_022072, partial [Pogonophryne albipinna]
LPLNPSHMELVAAFAVGFSSLTLRSRSLRVQSEPDLNTPKIKWNSAVSVFASNITSHALLLGSRCVNSLLTGCFQLRGAGCG